MDTKLLPQFCEIKVYADQFIHSFIHIEHLYSASSMTIDDTVLAIRYLENTLMCETRSRSERFEVFVGFVTNAFGPLGRLSVLMFLPSHLCLCLSLSILSVCLSVSLQAFSFETGHLWPV